MSLSSKIVRKVEMYNKTSRLLNHELMKSVQAIINNNGSNSETLTFVNTTEQVASAYDYFIFTKETSTDKKLVRMCQSLYLNSSKVHLDDLFHAVQSGSNSNSTQVNMGRTLSELVKYLHPTLEDAKIDESVSNVTNGNLNGSPLNDTVEWIVHYPTQLSENSTHTVLICHKEKSPLMKQVLRIKINGSDVDFIVQLYQTKLERYIYVTWIINGISYESICFPCSRMCVECTGDTAISISGLTDSSDKFLANLTKKQRNQNVKNAMLTNLLDKNFFERNLPSRVSAVSNLRLSEALCFVRMRTEFLCRLSFVKLALETMYGVMRQDNSDPVSTESLTAKIDKLVETLKTKHETQFKKVKELNPQTTADWKYSWAAAQWFYERCPFQYTKNNQIVKLIGYNQEVCTYGISTFVAVECGFMNTPFDVSSMLFAKNVAQNVKHEEKVPFWIPKGENQKSNKALKFADGCQTNFQFAYEIFTPFECDSDVQKLWDLGGIKKLLPPSCVFT